MEGLIISWLHEGYDVLCLSKTIQKPDLPFVSNSKNQDVKTFSQLHHDRKWGATIVLESNVSHFGAKFEVHTAPGLICAVGLHLPGKHRLLIASIYAPPDDPSAVEAIAKELYRLLLIFLSFVLAGDFNCAVQQIDTTAVSRIFWQWLGIKGAHGLRHKGFFTQTAKATHDTRTTYTAPEFVMSTSFSRKTFWPTSESPSIVHPYFKTKLPAIIVWTLLRS